MSHHKHKHHARDTKEVLETIQETRKATREIKAELLEHNDLIKIHLAAEQPEKEETKAEPKPAIRSHHTNDEAGGGENSSRKSIKESEVAQDAKESDDAKEHEVNRSDVRSLPVDMTNIMKPWLNMQMQMMRSMSSTWLNMLESRKSNASEASE